MWQMGKKYYLCRGITNKKGYIMEKDKLEQGTVPAPATFESVWASFAELRQLHKEIAQQHKEFAEEATAQRKEDRARSKEIEEAAVRRFQEAEVRLKKLEASIGEVNKMVGGTGRSNGYFAEEHFFNALEASHCFGNIRYDIVKRNEERREGNLKNEYDILMFNGTSVAIIETKYCVRKSVLEDLVGKKVPVFKILYPKYAKHKIYLGIASLSFEDAVITRAKELGIGSLKQVGNVVEYDTDHLKVY
jgi:hypothetical protein